MNRKGGKKDQNTSITDAWPQIYCLRAMNDIREPRKKEQQPSEQKRGEDESKNYIRYKFWTANEISA